MDIVMEDYDYYFMVCQLESLSLSDFESLTLSPMNAPELLAELSSLNFTALDVETANEQHDGLCALGMVRLKKKATVEEHAPSIYPVSSLLQKAI